MGDDIYFYKSKISPNKTPTDTVYITMSVGVNIGCSAIGFSYPCLLLMDGNSRCALLVKANLLHFSQGAIVHYHYTFQYFSVAQLRGDVSSRCW